MAMTAGGGEREGAAVRPRLNLLLSAEPAKGEARARRGR